MHIISQEMTTDNVILFLHIPKTGGTTLQQIINKQYKPHKLENLPFNEFSLQQKKKIALMKGHMLFGIHKDLPHEKFTYITIIRNPVERIISDFYAVRKEGFPYPRLRDIFRKMTLYEYVTDSKYDCQILPIRATMNFQTRLIAGTQEDNLELAKKNLKQYFSVVGITERYDDTLYVLKKKLGWKSDNYRKYNITPNKPTIKKIPEKIIEVLENKNQKDLELYRFANQLLDEQLK